MSSLLRLQAGPAAYQQILDRGLQAPDVHSIFGASGAAKWLAIYGLDRAIFGEWLKDNQHPIHLYGTSVGAFKLAAACRNNPGDSLEQLAEAYTNQSYPEAEFSADRISTETQKILSVITEHGGHEEILNHPSLHFNCGAVRTNGAIAQNQTKRQKLALARCFLQAFQGRAGYGKQLERAIFHHPASAAILTGADGITTHKVGLNKENLDQALLASGSIPGLMHGITNLHGAPNGTYFDGGMLDYHPVPSHLGIKSGLVLYPHFYQHLIPGWFDKFFSSRWANGNLLDNVLMISPSDEMVARMPGGQIPDRKDFVTLKNDDALRRKNWRQVMDLSRQLGDEFLELLATNSIASKLERLDG